MAANFNSNSHIKLRFLFISSASASFRHQNECNSNPRCSFGGEKVSVENQSEKYMVRKSYIHDKIKQGQIVCNLLKWVIDLIVLRAKGPRYVWWDKRFG